MSVDFPDGAVWKMRVDGSDGTTRNYDRHSFADSNTGLKLALETSLHLRRHGHKTRLVTNNDFAGTGFTVHTVVSTPPTRPSRKERGLVC